MPTSPGISALGVAVATAGAYLMYVGINDLALVDGLREITGGSLPSGKKASASGSGSIDPAALQSGMGSAVDRARARLNSGGAASGGAAGGALPTSFVQGGAHPEIAQAALKYRGVPYRWGGTDPRTGLDCSGLVQVAFADVGIKAPRTTYTQQPWSALVTISAAQAGAGDLVFWPGHVAIVVSPGTVVHAPRPGKVVEVVPVGSAGPRGTTATYKRYRGSSGSSGSNPGRVVAT